MGGVAAASVAYMKLDFKKLPVSSGLHLLAASHKGTKSRSVLSSLTLLSPAHLVINQHSLLIISLTRGWEPAGSNHLVAGLITAGFQEIHLL